MKKAVLFLDNLALSLVGKKKVLCPRCNGRGYNSRGDMCWPCDRTGYQVIDVNRDPFR